MRKPQRLTNAECTTVRIPIAIKGEVEKLTQKYIADKLIEEAQKILQKQEVQL
jgi:hypothetical protein